VAIEKVGEVEILLAQVIELFSQPLVLLFEAIYLIRPFCESTSHTLMLLDYAPQFLERAFHISVVLAWLFVDTPNLFSPSR
jgi:hypothetical protein